jgi:hypothetical protein
MVMNNDEQLIGQWMGLWAPLAFHFATKKMPKNG